MQQIPAKPFLRLRMLLQNLVVGCERVVQVVLAGCSMTWLKMDSANERQSTIDSHEEKRTEVRDHGRIGVANTDL